MGGAVIAAACCISSTAVAMKMMEDAGEKDSNAGRLALAILVAQDLAVVPLLLLTNALGAPASPLGYTLIAAKLALALGLLAGFIAILNRVKSFPLSGFRISRLEIYRLSAPWASRRRSCFAAAAGSGLLGLRAAAGSCGVLSGRAGRSAIRRCGAAPSPWPSRCKAFFCSCSSCRWGC